MAIKTTTEMELYASPIWRQLRWWHGVAFFVAMNVVSGGWLATRSYLDSVGRPPFMPPDWAFAPIWTALQALMIWAGFHLLQRMETARRRKELFWLYVGLWSFFSAFSWTYFGLHSPILGFLTTLGMFLTNALNVWFGYRERDKRYALLLTPLMLWLSLALAVSGWQLLYTPDELFGSAALFLRDAAQ